MDWPYSGSSVLVAPAAQGSGGGVAFSFPTLKGGTSPVPSPPCPAGDSLLVILLAVLLFSLLECRPCPAAPLWMASGILQSTLHAPLCSSVPACAPCFPGQSLGCRPGSLPLPRLPRALMPTTAPLPRENHRCSLSEMCKIALLSCLVFKAGRGCRAGGGWVGERSAPLPLGVPFGSWPQPGLRSFEEPPTPTDFCIGISYFQIA